MERSLLDTDCFGISITEHSTIASLFYGSVSLPRAITAGFFTKIFYFN
jgi:hypothetical protein